MILYVKSPRLSRTKDDRFLLECEYLIGDLVPTMETYDKQYYLLDEITHDIFRPYNEKEIASFKGGTQFEKNLDRAYKIDFENKVLNFPTIGERHGKKSNFKKY